MSCGRNCLYVYQKQFLWASRANLGRLSLWLPLFLTSYYETYKTKKNICFKYLATGNKPLENRMFLQKVCRLLRFETTIKTLVNYYERLVFIDWQHSIKPISVLLRAWLQMTMFFCGLFMSGKENTSQWPQFSTLFTHSTQNGKFTIVSVI